MSFTNEFMMFIALEAVFFDPLFGSSSLGGSEGGMTGTW